MVNSNQIEVSDWRSAPVGLDDRGARTEEAAFAADLIAATGPAFRVIRSLGLSPEDAADTLQEASIRAWRHRGDRRGEFRPWFVAIAYREARRTRRRWLTMPTFWSAPAVAAFPDDRSETLTAAVAALPQRQRAAISLRYDADMSTAGIAQAMGISEPAAKQLLARARASLRNALAASDIKVNS